MPKTIEKLTAKKPPFNRIRGTNMFATPKDMKALEAYCDRFTAGEKVVAFTVMGLTWNLAAKITDENLKNYPVKE